MPLHLPPSGSSEAGKTFGPYRVLEEIARGGQGVVMKARHEQLGTLVALKMLIQQRPKDLKSFEREAKTLAGLKHPNLLQVTDLGERNGIAYLAMEYVAGRSLDQILREGGPPPFEWTCRVLADVADALEHCHQRRLIHRDVKPANILMDGERVVLVDFGLVKRDPEQMKQSSLSGNSMVTKTGELKGTPRFMAPEQANAHKYGDVSPRTDVYALGATLFALLTGRDPFLGDALVSVIAAVLSEPPPDPRKLNPEVPQALRQLCLRSMAKDPAQRPASAAAFAEELRRLLATPEELAPSAGGGLPWSLLLNGALGLALVGALAWGASRRPEAPPPAPAAPGAAPATRDPLDAARSAIARGDPGAAAQVEALPAGPPRDLLSLELLRPRLSATDADRAFALLVGSEQARIPGWADGPPQRWAALAHALRGAGARAHAARAFVTAAARLGEADDDQAVRWTGLAFEADAREAAVSGKPVAPALLRWAEQALGGSAPPYDQVRRARAALIHWRLIHATKPLPTTVLDAIWRLGSSADELLARSAQPGIAAWAAERPGLLPLLRGRATESAAWSAWMQRGERKRTFDRLFLIQDMLLWQPRILSGWVHLGHAYNAVMDLRASQRAWEVRREYEVREPEAAAYDLAVCLQRQGRWDEALPHARAALEGLRAKGRRNAWMNMLLADLLVHAKRNDEALKTLDAIGGALDKHGRYWRTRARALEALGRRDEASRARARLQQLAGQAKGP